jgi:hypothetical protein
MAPAAEGGEDKNAAQLLFLSYVQRSKMQVSLVTMSCPSRTVAPPFCLPLDIKDSLRGEGLAGFLIGGLLAE